MKEGTAITIIEQKMKELGVGKEYLLRYRHLRLEAAGKLTIKAENHLYLFIEPDTGIKVESKRGVYDMAVSNINELQHVHSGIIRVENQTTEQMDAKFLQAIPLYSKK